MKPGPPPTPLHLKLMRGNPGKRRPKPEPEPTVPPSCPEPPSFITGYAADLWWETAPELHRLHLLTRIDVPALAAYCHAYGQWRLAAETLTRMQANDPVMNAQLIRTKFGDAAANPLVSIARKHAADMIKFANEFGLTAAARSRLAAGGVTPPSPPSKFAGLISDGTVLPMMMKRTSPPDAS
ncbi:phage terminase small subunit P27 family [Bradyrhizobium sp. BWC-3-1]|uniref:phage terminase small subunit P27 family n=1 Tax=Bradyrhizobium sp. BWC-3-1 TaxID=3080012 RepID=UPI00293EF790|nr:phage terminase small subunit P27 family [Bradyrhizobium sp. BWC-3-1]WOH60928.1 phage terminase small subunit P27 family [Bradyrhizobium sp. BWC-3-1]